jgi:hypothetical protein
MLWLVCASTVASAHGGPSDKPNFIIMLADDMGWGDVSCFIHSFRAELVAKERVTACAHLFFFTAVCGGDGQTLGGRCRRGPTSLTAAVHGNNLL